MIITFFLASPSLQRFSLDSLGAVVVFSEYHFLYAYNYSFFFLVLLYCAMQLFKVEASSGFVRTVKDHPYVSLWVLSIREVELIGYMGLATDT